MSDPTDAELIAEFLEELDLRIEGGRGTPIERSAVLVAMRPELRRRAAAHPARFAANLRELLAAQLAATQTRAERPASKEQ